MANNANVNKIVYGQTTLLDLTQDTVAADKLELGYTAHDRSGALITGTHEYNAFGDRAELIQSYGPIDIAFEDTNFSDWTPSTTAGTILTQSDYATIQLDMANYEYMLKWKISTTFVPRSGAELVSMPILQCNTVPIFLFKRPNNSANIKNQVYNYNASLVGTQINVIRYYNASGTNAITPTTSNGVYSSTSSTVAYSSTASNTPTLTIRRPGIVVKCSSAYLSESSAAMLDLENTVIRFSAELYRTGKGGYGNSVYRTAVEFFNEMDGA